MVIKRLVINFISFSSIINSIFLSYSYLESFFVDKHIKEMSLNFIMLLSTPIFITAITVIISIFKKNQNNFKITKIDFLRSFLIIFILVLIALSFWLVIYDFLKLSDTQLLLSSFLIIFEIISISFAIQDIREKAILKIFGYIALWAYLAIMCSTVIGVFVKYFRYIELDDSNVQIVFTGIFYHLFNACFLFYSALPQKIKY